MPRIKIYNNNTGQWEYTNTGTMPVKGIHYLTKEDYDQMKADIDSHFSGMIETISVTVVGNQSTSSTDLIGATVSVILSDGTPIASGTWEGSELTFRVGSGIEYYVRVDASEQGYNMFTSEIFTSEGGYSRSVEADVYAEKLTVNVVGPSSGFTITISGVGTQTSTSGSYLIPYGQSYTVSASSVSGYNTPSSINRTANSASYTALISYSQLYENLTIKVSGLSSGFTITVKSGATIIGTQTSTSKSYSIAYGTSYTISASTVDGYDTPTSVSYTASSSSRSVTMNYVLQKPSNGIYIATSAGQLISPDNWTSSSGTPVGVAVITDNSSYIIGGNKSYGIPWSSSSIEDISGIPNVTSDIVNYYDGVTYTDAMIEFESSTEYAAGYVRSKSINFGSLTLNGYLGSTGEWYDTLRNRTAIMNAFTTFGGYFPSAAYKFWTSVEFNYRYVWAAYWHNESDYGADYIYKYAETEYIYTVPFFKLTF